MRFGVTLPNAGLGGDPTVLADLARDAEGAGWDGVFIWDAGVPDTDMAADPSDPALLDVIDAWVALAVMASATQRVVLGPLIAPLSRRRPWRVAQESVSLDHLSRGRFVLPVGLGWTPDPWFRSTGEALDIRDRAARLDEALAIIDGLWSGDEVTLHGVHFDVDGLRLRPLPVQQPRIPIWVVGGWPSARSLDRAARWDGVIPQYIGSEEPLTTNDLRALLQQVGKGRATAGATGTYDVVIERHTPEHDREEARTLARRLEEAGVTWFLEAVWIYMYETPGRPDALRRRIRQGPPR